MGKFSKIFHHIETKDLRNKHKQKKAAKIQEEKKKKEFKQYLVSTIETKKYNWSEGMTTSDVVVSKEKELTKINIENTELIEKIDSIKNDESYVENMAREEFGLIKEGEEYFEIEPE